MKLGNKTQQIRIRYLKLRAQFKSAPSAQVLNQLQALEKKHPYLKDYEQLIDQQANRIAELSPTFKPFFASRVLHKIQHTQQEAKDIWQSLPSAFRWVVTPAMTLVLGLLIYNYTFVTEMSFDNLLGTNDLYWEDLVYDVPNP